MIKEDNIEDLKNKRFGYINQDSPVDEVVALFTKAFPGPELPKYWRHVSVEKFMEKYGNLGIVVWAKATNSHTLLINGNFVIRIWTDTKNVVTIEGLETVICAMSGTEPIPLKNQRKSRPFKSRIKFGGLSPAQDLIKAIGTIYGITVSI